jgi:mannosyltransferase
VGSLLDRPWRTLLALTLLALAVRSFSVGRQSFWYDEAESIRFTACGEGDLALGLGHCHDNGSPPFFFLLLKPWVTVLGSSETAARSLSVVLGTLIVPLLWLLGRRLVGPAPAMVAALLGAVSPFAVELSNDARTYALVMLLGVVDMLAFLRWREGRRRADLALWAVATFLACYSHYYAFALPLAQLTTVVLGERGEARASLFRGWLKAMVLAALPWLLWAPTFLVQISLREETQEGWLNQFLGTPVALTLGRAFAWHEASPALLAVAMLLAVGFFGPLAWYGLGSPRVSRFERCLLLAWFLIPIVPPFFVAVLLSPQYMVRYAGVGLPALLFLLGAGAARLAPRWRLGAVALIVALSAVSIVRWALYPLKDDWRSASALLLREAAPGDPLLFDRDHEVEAFRYYARERGQLPRVMVGVKTPPGDRLRGRRIGSDGYPSEPATRDWSADLLASQRVWVILCRPVLDAEGYEGWLKKRGGFTLVSHHRFFRLDVLRFER